MKYYFILYLCFYEKIRHLNEIQLNFSLHESYVEISVYVALCSERLTPHRMRK